eukprot:GHVR01178447.1.p1 GENE.GHVR01178447.1~~GHVR01178447.1.p1  ORF type:complete len:146 (+),score=68.64 GHVR01178447.1:215-652(+)
MHANTLSAIYRQLNDSTLGILGFIVFGSMSPVISLILLAPTRRSSPLYFLLKRLNFTNCLHKPRVHHPLKIEESMLAYTHPVEMSPYVERRVWWAQAQHLPPRLKEIYTHTHTHTHTHKYSHTNIHSRMDDLQNTHTHTHTSNCV